MQFPAGVCPAIGEPYILGRPFQQPIVPGIAVDLQDAREARQDLLCILARTPRRIGKGHAGWCIAVPRSIITGQSPEVSRFRFAPAGIEDRRSGLIHEELGGSLQLRQQCIIDGFEFKRCPSHPGGQGRPVQIHALAAVNLRLPVQGKMIGVFADDHMRHCGLGRHAARDQVRGSRGLDNTALTRAAGILRTAGDDNAELCRNNIQPLADVLTDDVPLVTAIADRVFRRDDLFDAWKMLGQRSPIDLARAGLATDLPVMGFIFGKHRFLSSLDIFQRQFILLRAGLLRPRSEHGALVIRDEFFQLDNAGFLAGDHTLLDSMLLLLGTNDGLQGINIVRKIVRRYHGADLSNPGLRHPRKQVPDSLCRSGRTRGQSLHLAPVETGKQRLELGMIERHQPIPNGGPGKRRFLQPFIRHHQPGAVPVQELQPIRPPGPEHKHRACERLLAQLILHQRSQPVMPLSEVHRFRRHHDPHPVRRKDHDAPFRARTIPATRTAGAAPSSRTTTSPQIISSGASPACTVRSVNPSTTIGANANSGAGKAGKTNFPWRACRRHSDR